MELGEATKDDVFAERFFGFQLGRRQWIGVTITAAGLVVIGLTGGGANDLPRASLGALIAVEGTVLGIGAALLRISARRHVGPRAEGLLLGAAAGALFGVSDVALKYLTQAPPGPLLGLLSSWALTALIAGVISFYASARMMSTVLVVLATGRCVPRSTRVWLRLSLDA